MTEPFAPQQPLPPGLIARNRARLAKEEREMGAALLYPQWSKLLMSAAGFLSLGFGVLLLITQGAENGAWRYILVYVVLGAFAFSWALFFGPRFSAAQRTQMNGMPPEGEQQVDFYPDRLKVELQGVAAFTIPYSDLLHTKETSALFVIQSRDRRAVVLRKNAFVYGDLLKARTAMQRGGSH